MATPRVLATLPIKGAIAEPLSGPQSNSAGYTPVLKEDGTLDPAFSDSLSKSATNVVANSTEKLLWSGARKGDIAKQLDNSLAYRLVDDNYSSAASWIALGVEGVTQSTNGTINIQAAGTDRDVIITPSGTGSLISTNIQAQYFYGDGRFLENLPAVEIVGNGELSDEVLSSNIPRLDTNNTFLDNITINGNTVVGGSLSVSGVISGNGAGLTNINASQVATGTLPVTRGGTGLNAYTVGNFLYASGVTTISQRTPSQVRNDIGADDASNLITGTIPNARLPAATTSAMGATTLTISAADAANGVLGKAATPLLVRDYIDSLTTTTNSVNKIVKTGVDGKIDPSLITIFSANGWSQLPGTSTDTGGFYGNVLSSLNVYDTPNNRGVKLSAIDASLSWYNPSFSLSLETQSITGSNKTVTFRNASGIVLLDVDAVTTSSAGKLVKMNGSGKIEATQIDTISDCKMTGNFRITNTISGAVSGGQTAKIAIYNFSGALLGYVPIYAS